MREMNLDTVLAGRPTLRPGEVVTIVAALAGELATLHANERVHGAVTTNAVVLDVAGRPRLVASAVAAGAVPPGVGADADVRALAQLALDCLGPYPPRQLLTVLKEASRGGVGARALVVQVLTGCRPEPVRLGQASDSEDGAGAVTRGRLPRPGTGARRAPRRAPWLRYVSTPRLGRNGICAVLAVLLVATVGVAGWFDAGGSVTAADGPSAAASASVPSSPRATGERSRWHAILTELDSRRAAAFAAADATALRAVYAPGSPALAADLELLRSYRRLGMRVRGLRLQIGDLQVLTASTARAVLRVTDRLGPYQVVDREGAVRQEPGRGTQRWRVTLRHDDHGRWRIASVHPRT